MMLDSKYAIETENPFVLLSGDGMARDQFQTVKRKRNNTDQKEELVVSQFMNSSSDEKMKIMFDELRIIRGGQEQMNRNMVNFQQNYKMVNDKLCEIIEVTNKNTNMMKTLAYKSIDLEARSRRNNLVFWGLLENYKENCYHIIRDFIQRHLDLDARKMYLARAHRLGPRKIGLRNPKRPIIVNFRDSCDTDMIMSRANMLRNTPFSVSYDLPKEINEARKKLWDELRSIKESKPRANFQILYPAKLIVDGKLVRDEFPDWHDVLHRSRTSDFVHIDNSVSYEQPQNTAELPTRDRVMFTNTSTCTTVNGNSSGTRDELNIHTGRGKVTEAINSPQLLNTESTQGWGLMDDDEPWDTQSTDTQTTSVHKPMSTEISSDLSSGTPAPEIIHAAADVHADQNTQKPQPLLQPLSQGFSYRPYDIDNTISQNSSEQSQQNNPAERLSRQKVRAERRKQSISNTRSLSKHDSRDRPKTGIPVQAKNRLGKTATSETLSKQRSVSTDSFQHVGLADASNVNTYSDQN